MKHRYYTALATFAITSGLALAVQPSFAQPVTGSDTGATAVAPTAGAGGSSGGGEPTNIPNHRRVNQVDQRDNNQQQRIDKGEADGQLSKGQAARDQSRLNHEEAVQKNQEAKNGGHLTKGEQRGDNRQMNRSSRGIHRQRAGGRRREHREHREHRRGMK